MEPIHHLSCNKGLTGFLKEGFFYFYYRSETKKVSLLHETSSNWGGASRLTQKKRSSILVMTVLLVSKLRFHLMQEVPKFSKSLFLIGAVQYP